MAFTPDPVVVPRVRQLLLLGFTTMEMLESLERHAGRVVAPSEVEWTIAHIHEQWGTLPEVAEVRRAQSQHWQRSEMFRSDMLALYGDLLANARATLEGSFTHPDGRPVISTKPAEVQGFADKILKAERDMLDDQRQALRLLGGAPPPPGPVGLPAEESEEDEWTSLAPTRTEL